MSFDPVISIVSDDCYNTCFIIVLFWRDYSAMWKPRNQS